MRFISLDAVRAAMTERHCPACTKAIVPGQKTSVVAGKRYHRSCAQYEVPRSKET